LSGMKRVGILYHPMIERAYVLAREIASFLESRGISVWLCSAWEGEKARSLLDRTDLLVTTGGDGTILRAVQIALPARTPITGINLGRLGFLTEIGAAEATAKLTALLNEEGRIDERAMLAAELIPPAQKKPAAQFLALNDVVVARGGIARLIGVEVSINQKTLTTYRTDGVIIATATGSTGYSLAARGPILHPRSGDMLLVPVAPHLGLTYHLVLPSDTSITLRVSTSHEATLSIDGHINMPLADGSAISIKSSQQKARFLRIQPEDSFYSSLEQKLKRNS
jgi:NAD+ kinase